MSECPSHQYLDDKAIRFSQKTAVTDGHSSITFGELAIATDQLGCLLVELGISSGERVVYFLKRSIDCIIATVGILKSGAAYVPLDQKTPAVRWQQIVQDAAPRAIICNKETLDVTLGRITKVDINPYVICLDSHVNQTILNFSVKKSKPRRVFSPMKEVLTILLTCFIHPAQLESKKE
jgi:non-ribosomal peptide synthetase component F